MGSWCCDACCHWSQVTAWSMAASTEAQSAAALEGEEGEALAPGRVPCWTTQEPPPGYVVQRRESVYAFVPPTDGEPQTEVEPHTAPVLPSSEQQFEEVPVRCAEGGSCTCSREARPLIVRQYSNFFHGSGSKVWDASHVMARWIVSHRGLFSAKRVLELGCGCGVAGLVAARFAAHVTLSDAEPQVLQNAAVNKERALADLEPDEYLAPIELTPLKYEEATSVCLQATALSCAPSDSIQAARSGTNHHHRLW